MEHLLTLFWIVLALFLIDQAGLWLERRGLLYWRRSKIKGGSLGPGLEEINRFMNPASQHVVEAKQTEAARRTKKDLKADQ